jgi:hypothetical protein
MWKQFTSWLTTSAVLLIAMVISTFAIIASVCVGTILLVGSQNLYDSWFHYRLVTLASSEISMNPAPRERGTVSKDTITVRSPPSGSPGEEMDKD